ncbi:acyltransferase [Comamonas faecalis]
MKPHWQIQTPPPPNFDSVRGLAILLLVFYHVVGNSPTRGLHLPMDSWWHLWMDSMELIRMPVFTILSGYLYGMRRVSAAEFFAFAGKKLKRLGIPLIGLTGLTLVLRNWVYGITPDWSGAFFGSYEHFWFLQALLIVFVIVSFVDVFLLPGVMGIALWVIAAAIVSAFVPVHGPFSVGQAVYLLPFFIAGIWIHESKIVFQRERWAGLFVVAAVLLWVAHALGVWGYWSPIERNSLLGTVAGVMTCIALLIFFPKINFFHRLGHYSYTIYLWHAMGLAAARITAVAMGVENLFVVFAVSAAGGLLGPVLLHVLIAQRPVLSVALLGVSKK